MKKGEGRIKLNWMRRHDQISRRHLIYRLLNKRTSKVRRVKLGMVNKKIGSKFRNPVGYIGLLINVALYWHPDGKRSNKKSSNRVPFFVQVDSFHPFGLLSLFCPPFFSLWFSLFFQTWLGHWLLWLSRPLLLLSSAPKSFIYFVRI